MHIKWDEWQQSTFSGLNQFSQNPASTLSVKPNVADGITFGTSSDMGLDFKLVLQGAVTLTFPCQMESTSSSLSS